MSLDIPFCLCDGAISGMEVVGSHVETAFDGGFTYR